MITKTKLLFASINNTISKPMPAHWRSCTIPNVNWKFYSEIPN